MGQIRYAERAGLLLSYVFAVGPPPQRPSPLRGHFRMADWPNFPREGRDLIATRSYCGDTVLAIKFAHRGNIRNGCVLMRPFLCAEASGEAIDLAPVHQVCPHICAWTKDGSLCSIGCAITTLIASKKYHGKPKVCPMGVLIAPFLPHGGDRRAKEWRRDPRNHS